MADNQSPQRSGAAGYNAAWSAVGYLIAGIGVWGFLGWLVERWLDLPRGVGIMTGMMLGAGGAIYLIVKRLSA